MAGERFEAKATFRASQGPAAQRAYALEDAQVLCNAVGDEEVTVPAGKSACLILSDTIGAWRYVRLESDVRGVRWWPINSETPSVDPDMRPFGYLLDWELPNYSHDHGALYTAAAVNHASVGTRGMYSELPSFMSFEEDQAAAFPTGGVFYADPAAAPVYGDTASRVHSRGYQLATHLTTDRDDASTYSRVSRLLIGKGAHWNLGTGNDGLGFDVVYSWRDTGSQVPPPVPDDHIGLVCHSYPFTASDLEGPADDAVTANGDVYWAPSDVNLCPRANPGGASFTDAKVSGSVVIPYVAVDGNPRTGSLRLETSAMTAAGGGTLRRVTMLDIETVFGAWNHFAEDSKPDMRVINVCFRPKHGAMGILRPVAYRPDAFWSGAEKPSIGFQNVSGRDARVRVAWGRA